MEAPLPLGIGLALFCVRLANILIVWGLAAATVILVSLSVSQLLKIPPLLPEVLPVVTALTLSSSEAEL